MKKLFKFYKKTIISFFIVYVFLIFLSNISPESFFEENREFELLEIIQNILLISSLVLLFQFRKKFVKVSNLLTYFLRQLLILFLLYEEISFLTFSSNNSTNSQLEFNLHNSNFFSGELFSLTIPITNSTHTITIETLLSLSILFIFGYGSYFVCWKKIKYLFLDKQLAIYSFMYFFNIVIYSTMRDSNIIHLLHIHQMKGEVLELFVYFLFFIDTLRKRKIMS